MGAARTTASASSWPPSSPTFSAETAGKQGLVTGIICQEDCESLWKLLEAEPGTEVTVSLEDKTWRAGAISGTFQIDDYVRWTLMEGLDDIALTLRHEDEIAAYEAARPSFKPSTLPAKTSCPRRRRVRSRLKVMRILAHALAYAVRAAQWSQKSQ